MPNTGDQTELNARSVIVSPTSRVSQREDEHRDTTSALIRGPEAMDSNHEERCSYPLLESLLKQRGLPLRGMFTNQHAAQIFGVSTRTVQEWCREGKLAVRDLPGRVIGPCFQIANRCFAYSDDRRFW